MQFLIRQADNDTFEDELHKKKHSNKKMVKITKTI